MENNNDPLQERRRVLAEALRNGDPVVVAPTGEVELKGDADEQGISNIQVPDGKLA